MSLVQQIRTMGYEVRLKPNGNLGLSPYSAMTEEHKEWVRANKAQIVRELRGASRSVQLSGLPYWVKPPVATVGTSLSKVIEKAIPKSLLSLVPKATCGCADYEKKMNQWGLELCISKEAEILDHLVKQSDNMGFMVKTVPKMVRRKAAKKLYDRAIQMSMPRRPSLPSTCAVITACDDNFIKGAYLLAWTVLHNTNTRFICYDLGITNSKMRKQMQGWGVEFRKIRLSVRDVAGWQTFNKPWYIEDALRDHETVLWLDSDVYVSGNLLEMYEMTKENMFVPDHGYFVPDRNANHQGLYNFVDHPVVPYDLRKGNQWPCAGVLGISASRDSGFIRQWQDRILAVYKNNSLGMVSYFDQGVFQDIFDGELVDGRRWNNLKAVRNGSVSDVFNQIKKDDSLIYHAGGAEKPWSNWQDMNWPDPRRVISK